MFVYEESKDVEYIDDVTLLWPVNTGLSVYIYIDDTKSYEYYNLSCKRIWFVPRIKDYDDCDYTVPMSIFDDPEILVSVKIDLLDEQVEKIRQFVRLNKNILEQMADMKISLFEFLDRIQKVV